MPGFIEQDRWGSFLDEFTKRNQLRATRLEVVGEIGAQEEEEYLPFVGVTLERKGSAAGNIEVVLGGETAKDQRRVEHLITRPERIAPLIGPTGLKRAWASKIRKVARLYLLSRSYQRSRRRHRDTKLLRANQPDASRSFICSLGPRREGSRRRVNLAARLGKQ